MDTRRGQMDCGFLAGPTVLPHIPSVRLLAPAVSGARRSALLPDVPTVSESGYAGFDASFALVLFAPRGTPPAIVQQMSTALADALKTTDVVDKLAQSDQAVVAAGPEATATRLAADSKTWGEVARRINLQLE